MSRKAQARAPRTVSIGDWKFEEPAELPKILAAMREVLPGEALGYRHEPLRGRELRSVLVGSNAQMAASDREHPVLPFFTSRRHRFWIGLQVKFTPVHGIPEFLSASLIVSRGLLAGEVKEKLLRAEWERARDSRIGPHAQPHWHVYAAAVNARGGEGRPAWQGGEFQEERRITLSDRVLPEAEVPLSEEDETDMAALDRFHWAMSARWHLEEPDAHYESPTAERLGAWVRSCSLYVRNQLLFLAAKQPNA